MGSLFRRLIAVSALLACSFPFQVEAVPPVRSTAGAAAVSGWQSLSTIDLTVLPSTTWTVADQGTTPTVGGVTFDLLTLPDNTATVGGGSGLQTTSPTAPVIGVRFGVDMSNRPILAVVAVVAQDDFTTNQQGWAVGDAWLTNSWRSIRTSATAVQVQRRGSAGSGFETGTLTQNTATAFAMIGTLRGTEVWYRTDAVSAASPPEPPPTGPGWTKLQDAVRDATDTQTWPISGSNGAVWIWNTNTASMELKGIAVYDWKGGA